MRSQCGDAFRFDRPFMAGIGNAAPKKMGDMPDEGPRRRSKT
ncbi:DUF6434 domain-containing protein [uncultured Sulfitobacter sp.]